MSDCTKKVKSVRIDKYYLVLPLRRILNYHLLGVGLLVGRGVGPVSKCGTKVEGGNVFARY